MKLEVRPAEDRDLPEVKRMIDECLAPDYYPLEKLKTCIRGEQNLFYVVTDADLDGTLAAFFYAFMSRLDEALEIHHMEEMPPALQACGPDTRVGVYKTVSTAKKYRKGGICSSFVRSMEPVMRERGAKMILVPAMRSPEGAVPAKNILQDNGFVPIADVCRPWEDLDIYCPFCGHHHCICDAVLYMKELDEIKEGDFRE